MKRPAGVILTAILLGLSAGLTLLTGLGIAAAGLFTGHTPQNPVDAAAPIPPPAFLTAMLLVIAVLLLLAAAWQIATIVGLLRLRKWARYSVLVLAGLMTIFGLFSVASAIFGALLMPAIMAQANSQTQTAAFPPHLMQAVFLIQGLFYLGVTGIGIWWLVYYNGTAVRRYFDPSRYPALPLLQQPTNPPVPQVTGPQAPQQSPNPNIPPLTAPPASQPYYVPAAPRQPGRFTHVPWPILVIAGFFALSSLSSLALCWIPFPAFVLGTLLYSPWNHLTFLALSLAMGLLAWGLVRLENRARLGIYAFTVYAVLNFALMLTPHGRASYRAYQQSLLAPLHLPISPYAPAFDVTSAPFVLLMILSALLFYGLQLWAVEHYRPLFQPSLKTEKPQTQN